MAKTFDASLQKLRSSHAEELLKRISLLKERVQAGRYDEDDLSQLSDILQSIRRNFVGNDKRLSEAIGMTSTAISATYSGKSRPKFHNFIRMLHGAEKICANELRFPGSQDVNSSNDGSTEFLTPWTADWIAIDANQKLISDLCDTLERLIVMTKRPNLPSEEAASNFYLTNIQKE